MNKKDRIEELERQLKEALADRDIWFAVATRKTDKLDVLLGDDRITTDVQAGYFSILTSLCRNWVEKAPRFMEAVLEDNKGKLLLTIRKYETPSPITLLKKTEKELENAKLKIKKLTQQNRKLKEANKFRTPLK